MTINYVVFDKQKIKIRELEINDFDKGFLELLGSKYYLGTLTKENIQVQFNRIKLNPHQTIFVAEKMGRIVGVVTLLIFIRFNKFQHNLGKLEDVIIAQEENPYIEDILIKKIYEIAKKKKCNEIYLHTNTELKPVYKNLGIKKTNSVVLFEEK